MGPGSRVSDQELEMATVDILGDYSEENLRVVRGLHQGDWDTHKTVGMNLPEEYRMSLGPIFRLLQLVLQTHY